MIYNKKKQSGRYELKIGKKARIDTGKNRTYRLYIY